MPDRQIAGGSNNTISLRKWNWPLTKTYNGFTPQERVRGWQVSHWLQATGQLIDPKQNACRCSICGSPKNVAYHNENYYAPWTAKLVCKSCHYLIHTRFRNGYALVALVKRAARRAEATWVLSLSNQKIDLAGKLRAENGEDVRNFPSLTTSSCPFPFDELYSLKLDIRTPLMN